MHKNQENYSLFLHSERLYLRPLEPDQDYQKFALWSNSEEMRRFFNVYPISNARARERIHQFYQDFRHILFGVSLNSNHELIGLVGLKDINTLNQSAEFYIKIDTSVQGQGYGTEATKLMLRYGFLELNLYRIQTQDMDENRAGWRADEKAGFQLEGVMRGAILRTNRYHDVRIYSILRPEFMEQHIQNSEDR